MAKNTSQTKLHPTFASQGTTNSTSGVETSSSSAKRHRSGFSLTYLRTIRKCFQTCWRRPASTGITSATGVHASTYRTLRRTSPPFSRFSILLGAWVIQNAPRSCHQNGNLSDGRFPHRHETPDLVTFSALLRMTTKYQLEETRSQILLDLVPAYPTKFSGYQGSPCRGEAVFGTPLPHPNSVLDLLIHCKVGFALPFAYYRVCVAGDPASLNTNANGGALSPETLKTALRGQSRLKEGETQFAKKLAFRECTAWRCAGKRAEVYDWITPDMALTNGILEREDFTGSGYCYKCMQAFPQELSKAKEGAWKSLPSYFDLPPWDDAAYQFGS